MGRRCLLVAWMLLVLPCAASGQAAMGPLKPVPAELQLRAEIVRLREQLVQATAEGQACLATQAVLVREVNARLTAEKTALAAELLAAAHAPAGWTWDWEAMAPAVPKSPDEVKR